VIECRARAVASQGRGFLSAIVRPSRADDLEALYEMAKLTGGGFTNLPPDRPALAAKLARSEEAFAREADVPGDDLYMLVLEESATGRVAGTAQIFARIGTRWPFYSYRLGMLSQTSKELHRTFRAEMLTLVTDLEGSAEVGGLFLHPRERAGGLGLLLARSRYLFVRQHRARFADRMIAELRGVIDEAGGSPFWDGLAGKFFGMGFQEADEFNAVNGHQFIADLMPKHPIYTAMLPDSARAVIGLPHPSGRAAMRMLENEGFTHNGYVDIFDGGPTMSVATDQIHTVRDARQATVGRVDATLAGGARAVVAHGRLREFRAGYARIIAEDSQVAIDAEAADILSLEPGAQVTHVPR
jgi:arginine N-succinyltransferase